MQLKIDKQIIKRVDKAQAVADSIKYLQVEFVFSEDWQGFVKTVITKSFDKSTVFTQLMADDDTYVVPVELLKSPGLWLSVVGNLGEVQITTNDFRVDVVASGLAAGVAPPEPSPTLFEQLMGEFSEAKTETAASAGLAADAATIAESYAKGSTASREGEDIDNAKYYKEQAETAADSIGNAVELSQQAAGVATTAKNEAVNAKDTAVAAKLGAEQAKENALASENKAKLSETNSATSEASAANAKAGAEAAKMLAETAKDFAETAKIGAESARNAAQVAKADAETAVITAGQIIADGKSQLQSVTNEGISQVGKVLAEGNKQVALVEAVGGEQVKDINAVGAEKVDLVESTADSKIAVMSDKEAVATAKALEATNEANRAKTEADRAAEIVGGGFPTKTEAQGYVDTHNAAMVAHTALFAGKADLVSGKVPESQLPPMDYDPLGSAATVDGRLTNHTNDSVKHITAAERTTWNAKETPSGAQAKANAAEANAKAASISLTQKGAANGVASLDSAGKVIAGQLPAMEYVPNTATINGKKVKDNPVLTAADVGAATPVDLDKKADKETQSGGFVGGKNANMHPLSAGAAIGLDANSQGGVAIGANATCNYGTAIGYAATAEDGGAVGFGARTSNGFVGGKDARAVGNDNFTPIDAIQLGTGTNQVPNSLQVYRYPLMNPNGSIPKERLPNGAITAIPQCATQAELEQAVKFTATGAMAGSYPLFGMHNKAAIAMRVISNGKKYKPSNLAQYPGYIINLDFTPTFVVVLTSSPFTENTTVYSLDIPKWADRLSTIKEGNEGVMIDTNKVIVSFTDYTGRAWGVLGAEYLFIMYK